MAIVTNVNWIDKKGNSRVGYYMDGWLAQNLAGIPGYLKQGWDAVGIVSGHGKVRIGKTLAKDTKVKIIKDEKIIDSKPLGDYKDGERLNTLSFNPNTGEVIPTIAEVIKEVEDKEFYIMELEDGKKVTCSMDHKFYVKRGNKIIVLPLKEIKEGDNIVCSQDNLKQG